MAPFDTLAESLMGDGAGGGGMNPGLLAGLAEMFVGQGGPGLQGLVGLFHQAGLAEVVNSWVGTGPNLAVSAEEIAGALGEGNMAQLSAKAGLTPGETASQLAQYLPVLIDKLTSGGSVPEGGLNDMLTFLHGR